MNDDVPESIQKMMLKDMGDYAERDRVAPIDVIRWAGVGTILAGMVFLKAAAPEAPVVPESVMQQQEETSRITNRNFLQIVDDLINPKM